jgi:hypothetical protein
MVLPLTAIFRERRYHTGIVLSAALHGSEEGRRQGPSRNASKRTAAMSTAPKKLVGSVNSSAICRFSPPESSSMVRFAMAHGRAEPWLRSCSAQENEITTKYRHFSMRSAACAPPSATCAVVRLHAQAAGAIAICERNSWPRAWPGLVSGAAMIGGFTSTAPMRDGCPGSDLWLVESLMEEGARS